MEIMEMQHCHVRAVAELEKLCFSAPWSENAITSELANPLSAWLVAMEGDRLLGYIGSQTVLDEADMMNIAVSSEARCRGVARQLVLKLVELLKAQGVHCISLEVRATNDPAKALYEGLGFIQVGRRPNYYRNPKEDALILRKEWEV